MKACWKYNPRYRPTFGQIIENLLPDVNDDFRENSFFFSPENKEKMNKDSDCYIVNTPVTQDQHQFLTDSGSPALDQLSQDQLSQDQLSQDQLSQDQLSQDQLSVDSRSGDNLSGDSRLLHPAEHAQSLPDSPHYLSHVDRDATPNLSCDVASAESYRSDDISEISEESLAILNEVQIRPNDSPEEFRNGNNFPSPWHEPPKSIENNPLLTQISPYQNGYVNGHTNQNSYVREPLTKEC